MLKIFCSLILCSFQNERKSLDLNLLNVCESDLFQARASFLHVVLSCCVMLHIGT